MPTPGLIAQTAPAASVNVPPFDAVAVVPAEEGVAACEAPTL
jgi:hypothetical protein